MANRGAMSAVGRDTTGAGSPHAVKAPVLAGVCGTAQVLGTAGHPTRTADGVRVLVHVDTGEARDAAVNVGMNPEVRGMPDADGLSARSCLPIPATHQDPAALPRVVRAASGRTVPSTRRQFIGPPQRRSMNTGGPTERHPSTRSAPGPAAGGLRRPVLTPVSTHAAASGRSPAVNKVLRISPICCLTGD